MKVYLSIDLDYWKAERTPGAATRFFKKLYQKFNRQIMVAFYHHHLVSHVNSVGIDTVINLDSHSDLSDNRLNMALEEGNWVNFVNCREHGTYVWRYPRDSCLTRHTGYCHLDNRPIEKVRSGWAHVKIKRGLARIPWDKIAAVGVCLSPEWLDENQGVVSYPIETLNYLEWCGRWWIYGGRFRSGGNNMDNGTGIFRPRLTSPKL